MAVYDRSGAGSAILPSSDSTNDLVSGHRFNIVAPLNHIDSRVVVLHISSPSESPVDDLWVRYSPPLSED